MAKYKLMKTEGRAKTGTVSDSAWYDPDSGVYECGNDRGDQGRCIHAWIFTADRNTGRAYPILIISMCVRVTRS